MQTVLQTLHLRSGKALVSNGFQSSSERHWLRVAQMESKTAGTRDVLLRLLREMKGVGSGMGDVGDPVPRDSHTLNQKEVARMSMTRRVVMMSEVIFFFFFVAKKIRRWKFL